MAYSQDRRLAHSSPCIWFLQEQREEVSSVTDLLAVVERGRDNFLHVEEYLARASGGENAVEANAPPAAGGAL